jgi:hypothetical protein
MKRILTVFLIVGVQQAATRQTIKLTSFTPVITPTLENVFVGAINITGEANTFIWWGTAPRYSIGYYNTFVGSSSGSSNTTGYYNAFLGALSGAKVVVARGNTLVGFSSGSCMV